MTTVTRDGVTYEVEDGWRDMEQYITHTIALFMFSDGSVMAHSYGEPKKSLAIAWRPIVPPKVKRWRAERDHLYWFVTVLGNAQSDKEVGYEIDDARYEVGNYFRTREEAESSNKARVMRDPESER